MKHFFLKELSLEENPHVADKAAGTIIDQTTK